jgi:hypothetical protein
MKRIFLSVAFVGLIAFAFSGSASAQGYHSYGHGGQHGYSGGHGFSSGHGNVGHYGNYGGHGGYGHSAYVHGGYGQTSYGHDGFYPSSHGHLASGHRGYGGGVNLQTHNFGLRIGH